jgi:hypothetical protein
LERSYIESLEVAVTKKRAWIWLGSISLGILLLMAAFLYVVLLVDPFKWGRVHSAKFTWEKFANVKEGERIEAVIDRLGAPVRPAEPYRVMTVDPHDPCVRGVCRKYLFAGALWGATFREAIVITDSGGQVIHAEARQE